MNRSPKYYAARAAAINEALENYSSSVAAPAADNPAAISSWKQPKTYEAFRDCGKVYEVTLFSAFPHYWGDHAGEVVPATYLYSHRDNSWIGRIQMDGKTWIVTVYWYSKANDTYNLATSLEAVF